MKHKLSSIMGLALCAGLVACTTPQNAQQVSQKTVNYMCGTAEAKPLRVQYTFQGNEALAAKIIYQNQAVDLTRTTTSNTEMVGNTFRGNGYTWTTDQFTMDNVGQVNGNMLTQDIQKSVNGQMTQVSNILVKDCRVMP